MISRQRTNKPRTYGFTIAEILLVIALIAVLAGLGGGIYAGTYKNMLVKKSARDFLLAAEYARGLAIERQRLCRIEIDTDENRFVLVTEEFDEDAEQKEQVVVRDIYFKPIELPGDVGFEDVQIKTAGFDGDFSERNEIVFSPNGTAQTAAVQIGDGKSHYTVTISGGTGRVKVYAGAVEDVKTDTVDLDEQWY